MAPTDIRRLARACNMRLIGIDDCVTLTMLTEQLEEFARLVADHEREACARAAEDAPVKTARQDMREACAAAIRSRGEPKELEAMLGCSECGVTSSDDSMYALYCVACFKPVIEAAVKAEREACARVAESFDPEKRWSNHGQVIARWIRERGETCPR